MYICSAKSIIGVANSYGFHWELFFCQDISDCINIKDIAPTEWRYGNASKISPMVDLAARSRRFFMLC